MAKNDALLGGITSGLDSSLNSSKKTDTKKKSGELGQNEFLQLLVTQLKNQDPMNPMENQEFAVQLAQFSQLEQLVAIKDKVTSGGSSGEISSIASFLGNNVELNTDKVQVKDNNGGEISFNLPADTAGVRVELLDKSRAVKENIDLGPIPAGRQSIALTDLGVQAGTFTARVVANNASGGTITPKVSVSGIVSGFIPGADPKLIVGGSEFGPADVTMVRTPA